jgi:acetolactate synthase regulatory subunit
LVTIVVLAVLAGGGYVGFRHFHDSSSASPTVAPRLPVCHRSLGNALFAAPGQVRLRIRNGSLQTGLAARVRSVLRHRGFHVVSIGNAVTVGHDVAAIRFAPAQQRAARTLAAHIAGPVQMQSVATGQTVELDLGLRFAGLKSARAALLAERQALGSVPGQASPTPSASPTCRSS